MDDARSEIDFFVGSDSKVFYVHNGDQEMQMEEVRGQVGSVDTMIRQTNIDNFC